MVKAALNPIEVFRLAAEGYNSKEIGKELGYSYKTIDNIKCRYLKANNYRNTTHAVVSLIKLKLIEI